MADPLRDSSNYAGQMTQMSLPYMAQGPSSIIPSALQTAGATQDFIQEAEIHRRWKEMEDLRRQDYIETNFGYRQELETRAIKASVQAQELQLKDMEWESEQRRRMAPLEEARVRLQTAEARGELASIVGDQVRVPSPTGPGWVDATPEEAARIRRLRAGEDAQVDYTRAMAERARRPQAMSMRDNTGSEMTLYWKVREKIGELEKTPDFEFGDDETKAANKAARERDLAELRGVLGELESRLFSRDQSASFSGEPITLTPDEEPYLNQLVARLARQRGISREEAKKLIDEALQAGDQSVRMALMQIARESVR